MKTPREILLERHRAAAPKLDAIRQSAVAALCDRRLGTGNAQKWRSRTAAAMIWHVLWRELVWPCRQVWAGLTAVWFFILAVNFSMYGHSQSVAETSTPEAEVVLTWQQQEELLAEMIGPNELRAGAPVGRNASPERPRPSLSRPHGERLFEMMTA